MILTELLSGEGGVLLAVPHVSLPSALRVGGKVSLIVCRPELAVVEAGGTRYALASELAKQMIVVRAP